MHVFNVCTFLWLISFSFHQNKQEKVIVLRWLETEKDWL